MSDHPSSSPSSSANPPPASPGSPIGAPLGADPHRLKAALAAVTGQTLPYAGSNPGPPSVFGSAAQILLWQGQFPPPDAVERYEKVHPGAFARILEMAEFAQRTQADDTKRAHNFAQADTRRAQYLGAATTTIALFCAVGCGVFGAMIDSTGLLLLAGSFVSVPVMAVGKVLVESARAPTAKEILKAGVSAAPQPTAGMQPPSTSQTPL